MNDRDRQDETPEDDTRAFRSAMQGVKPLRGAERGDEQRPATPRPRRKRRVYAGDSPGEPPPLDAEVLAEDSLQFRRPGVQDQLFRKLRRGLIVQQADLDLHGLTLREAWECLDDFIQAGRARGLRCVRVVHGKGYRSGARGPVLKSAVNAWLRHHHDVIAFASARAIDGGTGAVYVLLRA